MNVQCLIACTLTIALGAVAESAEFPLGLEAMQHPERLPVFLPNGTQTKQFITYDPAGQNRSGFFKRYEDNGEYVFFDEIGPGCLYRQQMNVFSKYTKFPANEVHIRYYFDDEARPRVDMTFAEFFGKGGKYAAPFTPPLAYFDEKQWMNGPGAYAILYYPFAFHKRLKITAYHPAGMKYYEGTWFQYTYLKYPPGTTVETWKGRDVDSPAVRTQFERKGQDPKPPVEGVTNKNALADVAPNETRTALDLTGQGAITSLRIRMEPWSPDAFFHTRLKITWDGQAAPAIDMSLASFFGGGGDTIGVEDVSGKTLSTSFYGFDAKTRQCYAYWPMPYWSRAHVEIVNNSHAPLARVDVEAVSVPPAVLIYRPGESGYFCAKRTVDISPDGALYSQAFLARGRGKVVGLSMYSNGFATDGDEYTYIDGSQTPQIHGDGTEDDHNQGWGGYAIQMPYWGGLIDGYQGGYRLYVGDSYLFDSSIDIRYEHSPCGAPKNSGQKTDFVVWYYQDIPGTCNLRLTDQLDVGKPASEKAHQYRVTGEKWSGVTASSYDRMEYAPHTPTTVDDGRAFTGASEFTVKIDPANEGVKIRRRANRTRSNVQRTDVYVDGQLLADAPWYLCDLAAEAEVAFGDTDYEIPAAYTKGKDRLTIKLQHVAGGADDSSNEYYYWIYCYGRTPIQTERTSTSH
jgi:hypothetical protein